MANVAMVRLYASRTLNHTRIVNNIRQKYTRRNEHKRVSETVAKFLEKRHKLRSKFYDSPVVKKASVSSVQLSGGKIKAQVNKNILLRERTVKAVLIREIQEVIDSGQVCEELKASGVQISHVVMNSKFSAVVFWEPLGGEEDVRIQELFNRHSGYIRHIMMHNHVIGHIPTMHFALDESVAVANQLGKIFSELELEKPEAISEERQDEVQRKSSTINNTASFKIFGIDHEVLNNRIMLSKQALTNTSEETNPQTASLFPKGINLKNESNT